MRRAPDPPLRLAEGAEAPAPSACLQQNPDVLTIVLEHGAILLDLRTATYYRLDRAGQFGQEPPSLIKHDEQVHGASAVLSDSEATRGWPGLRSPLPFVTVIVPVRDGARTLRDCLASLLASDYPADRREIVVVDNDSKDRTAEIIRDFPVRHAQETRRGASASRNRGIQLSQGEILAFTDADCVVSNTWLSELVRGFESDKVGAVAGEIMAFPPSTGPERYMARRVPRWQRANLDASRPSIVTASIAVRKPVFHQIGVFDPYLTRAQDTDFGWRFFRECPLELRYSARAIVLHRHRATTWDFFRHQANWGYGGVLVGLKYRLPSGMREELRLWGALMNQLLELGGAAARYARHGRRWDDLEYAYFDLLCRLARRLGALRGLAIDRQLHRDWARAGTSPALDR